MRAHQTWAKPAERGRGLSDNFSHENLGRRAAVTRSSDRSFGIVFAVFFLALGLLPLRHGLTVRWLPIAIAILFAVAAIAAPRLLAPLNKLWAHFGELLHRMTTPLIMALLFYGALTPCAVIMRIAGRDPLRLKRATVVASYWIERDPPGPKPDSLNQAF